MLGDQVAYLLQRYLGNFVRGFSKEALSISVWRGNVELTNMQLKPEALNALKLPVKVKTGFLGSVKLKVPWSRIGQEPVLVYLDRIYLLAEPETQVEGYSEDADMEMKMLESRLILTTEMIAHGVLGVWSPILSAVGNAFKLQVWSRRITGVGDGFLQGTEALAQGVAFGVSGVVRKPVESARQNGLLGLAHGIGQACLGFVVQPVSGALDFFSLTVDGIGASFSRCLEVINNKSTKGWNPQAIRADNVLREYSEMEAVGKVPSSQKHVSFAWNENDSRNSGSQNKSILKSRDFLSRSLLTKQVLPNTALTFQRFAVCQIVEDSVICSIWRPVCPEGYISVGDIARSGTHPPNVAAVYQNTDRLFALPLCYDLVWRNCADDYATPVSIWQPRPPQGYVSAVCVAMCSFTEPEPDLAYCMGESIAEETTFEEQQVCSALDSSPWTCCIYQVRSPALHFVALRQPREEAAWKPMRVIDDTSRPSVSLLSEASSSTSGQ